MTMICRLLMCIMIFIIFIHVCSSQLDKEAYRDVGHFDSDFLIENVKLLLKSKSMKENIENERLKLENRESRLKRIDILRKSLAFKFHSQGLQYKLDPDAKKNMTQLIMSQGYPVERYTVQTEDGFLLDLHRIPHGKNNLTSQQPRPVIFLQHGFISSACDWVMNFANDSLGFILADHGYDVWMGNSRGNTYSQGHVSLKPDDEKFWDWSFHEMGIYDGPAFLDFILNTTGQTSLYYVGHSQGSVTAFIMLSQKPEYQKKIRLFVGLAPFMSIHYKKSPLKYFSVLTDNMIYNILGRRDYLPHNALIEALVDTFCPINITEWACNSILFFFTGPDISNLNTSRVEVYMDHTPAGASVKDLVHYSQMYRQKRFAMYDYGSPGENMKHYNNATPPAYDVTKVALPSLLFSGTNDWMADPADVAILNSTLPNIKGSYVIEGWNHLDFVWGTNAAVRCYNAILAWLSRF